MRERRRAGDQARRASVDRQLGTPRDSTRIGPRVDLAGLERRNLRQVEHVDDVHARPRDLDPAEAVDREVAERMRRRSNGNDERCHRNEEEDEPLHDSHFRATGAQSNEKCGFSASARRSQARAVSP